MTSKLSWILFIPMTIAAVFLKLAQTLLPDGAIFGLSDMVLDYAVIGCVALVFLFALIMCIADRRISPYYMPHRNIPAGILGLLLAIVCAADGANKIYFTISSGKVDAMEIVEASLLLLSSIVFIVMGLTHSFVNRDGKRFALFNVMPALLCAVRLVRCFIGFTTISITLADVTQLICYIFATMFFFNFAVAISLTEAKHAVKSCFIFGFPAMTALFACGVASIVNSFNVHELFSNTGMVEMVLMGLYIFAFILELSIFIKDRDHIVIADDGNEYDELTENDTEPEENFIVTGMDDENRFEPDNGYLTSPDFEDYLYRESENPNSNVDNSATQSDPSGYITIATDPHTGKTLKRGEFPKDPEPNAAEGRPGYADRLDEIDKLILEITGDYRD